MDSCEFAREANSSIDCSSISSISQYCLYSHSVDQLYADIEHYMKVLKKDPSFNINLDSHPACWLTQLFSDGLPEDSVVNTLLNILRRTGPDRGDRSELQHRRWYSTVPLKLTPVETSYMYGIICRYRNELKYENDMSAYLLT
jgi:hypothetical protein